MHLISVCLLESDQPFYEEVRQFKQKATSLRHAHEIIEHLVTALSCTTKYSINIIVCGGVLIRGHYRDYRSLKDELAAMKMHLSAFDEQLQQTQREA